MNDLEKSIDKSIMNSTIYDILDAIPNEILILNADNTIHYANSAYLHAKNLTNILGKPFQNIITRSLLINSNLGHHINNCMSNKVCLKLNDIKYESSFQTEKTVNITISPVAVKGQTLPLITFNYKTEYEELRFQLEIIRDLGFFMVGTLDLNKLLFLILTGITAGPALGFNRAFILLVDETKKCLRSGMGVGPASAEEAGIIWSRVSAEKRVLKDFLYEYETIKDKTRLPMSLLAEQLHCDLGKKENILVKTVFEKKIFHITGAYTNKNVDSDFINIYKAGEFITAPLIAEDKVLGVIIADNMFNNNPIREKHKNFLKVFTYLAG
ncbi:MAG: hypothetical protein ABIA63_06995, partial [bacterium]